MVRWALFIVLAELFIVLAEKETPQILNQSLPFLLDRLDITKKAMIFQ